MIGSSSSKVQLLRRRARRKSDKILFVGRYEIVPFLRSFVEFFTLIYRVFSSKSSGFLLKNSVFSEYSENFEYTECSGQSTLHPLSLLYKV